MKKMTTTNVLSRSWNSTDIISKRYYSTLNTMLLLDLNADKVLVVHLSKIIHISKECERIVDFTKGTYPLPFPGRHPSGWYQRQQRL